MSLSRRSSPPSPYKPKSILSHPVLELVLCTPSLLGRASFPVSHLLECLQIRICAQGAFERGQCLKDKLYLLTMQLSSRALK